jgi:hypothetical protein
MSRGGSYKPIVIGSETQVGSQDIRSAVPSVLRGATPQQYIKLAAGGDMVISPLCGDHAPTITGGFAKWVVIDRPQRIGMTVLQGYDPYVMTLDLLFDAVVAQAKWDNTSPSQRLEKTSPGVGVEDALQKLDFMAGRGYLNKRPTGGDSPLIQVSSASVKAPGSNPTATNLIPPNMQNRAYILTGLTYDASPLRAQNGDRIRQQVTVVLTQYIDSPGAHLDSSAYRQALTSADGSKYKVFRLTKVNNTILKITVNLANNTNFAAAQAVLQANRYGNAELICGRTVKEDLTKHNALGTPVRVPLTVIDGLV